MMSYASERASGRVGLSASLRLSLSIMSLGAAAVHFAVIQDHFDEATAFGLFFAVVAWLQAAWALAVALAPTRRLLVAGMIGNVAVIAVWVLSRTAGLPLGPEPGEPETAAFIDISATVLEALIAAAALLALVRRESERWLQGRRGVVVAAALSLVVVSATTAAIATAANHAEGATDESKHSPQGSDHEGT